MSKKKAKLLTAATKIASINPEPTQSLLPVYNGGFEKSHPVTDAVALREARLIKESSFDRIWKYYYEPKKAVELTDHEDDMRRRLSNMWDLLTAKVLNDKKAVRAHIIWCKDNCMTISERTAYDDLRRAKHLFGDPRVNTPVFEKARISSILLELIETAKTTGDLDNAQRLIRRYNAINGLEEDIKTQLPRAPITIVFTAEEAILKKQAEELMTGVTIDVEHTEEPE
jgi:hypothetical protein